MQLPHNLANLALRRLALRRLALRRIALRRCSIVRDLGTLNPNPNP